MEIERKFLIKKIPFQLDFIEGYIVNQNYISINPEVRIRKKSNNKEEYFITTKSEGDLVREEKELPITEELYNILHTTALGEDIIKNTYVFTIDNNKKIECSIVDFDRNTKFMYAEIEFDSVSEANSFELPSFLGKETTYDKKYKMKNYFCSTRLNGITSLLRKI